jgi:murein DD-endopeptidase MepM/ murein hydrolase activator NlpD
MALAGRTAAWVRAGGRRERQRDPWRLFRWTTHLSVLGLSAAAIVAGAASAPPRMAAQYSPAPPAELVAGFVMPVRGTSARGGSGFLVRAAVPRTSTSEAAAAAVSIEEEPAAAATEAEPAETRTYVVQPGDTVIGLAARFGLTPETILSANPSLAGNPDLLKLGQELQILPVSGVLHKVVAGDTLVAIAKRYEVSVDAIIGYQANELVEPYILHPGQEIVVPGGKWSRAAAQAAAAGTANATGQFVWPTTGRLTQQAWWGHMAIDLGAPTGTPIYASDAGKVLEAGWTNVGYGQYVLVDHGNGYRTLYAHMSKILVQRGQSVAKGERIGLVGSTGNSTGPHLHFEIYRNGVLQNPLNYLP